MIQIEQVTEILQLLGEPTRIRLLALLEEYELSVTELTAITRVAQSRISTHLARLRDAGLVRDRRAGTSVFYRLDATALPEAHARLWRSLRSELGDAALEQDRRRALEVIEARAHAAPWPELVAGEMERHYSPGRTWEATARALVGLCDLGDVLDIGSGDGALAELLASRATHMVCVDASPHVARAARARLAHLPQVQCSVGDMHALPVRSARFDQALMLNVLTHAHDPALALREAARALRPRGRLVVVTLDAHAHEDVTRAYQHVRNGFSPAELKRLLADAGFEVASAAVTSIERRTPGFRVVTAFASKPARTRATRSAA